MGEILKIPVISYFKVVKGRKKVEQKRDRAYNIYITFTYIY